MNWRRSAGRHRRRTPRGRRGALAATLSTSAALALSWAPSAPAATVLVAEGTAQPAGTAQTAFSGAFCAHNTCRSIRNARHPFGVAMGSQQMQDAIDATQGPLIVMGFSLGAASVYDRMRAWENEPAIAPDVDRLKLIVTFGNPENKYGGDDRKNSYAGLPEAQPYQHLDVAMQYDSVADRPTRWGWYSMINLTFARHLDYFDPIDINDPDNLVYQDADGSTYMLIKADVLPMLKWMDWFTTDERMAELDAKYRPLVERDYDRPDYIPQGEGADWGNGTPSPTVETSPGGVDDAGAATPMATDEPGRTADDAQSGGADPDSVIAGEGSVEGSVGGNTDDAHAAEYPDDPSADDGTVIDDTGASDAGGFDHPEDRLDERVADHPDDRLADDPTAPDDPDDHLADADLPEGAGDVAEADEAADADEPDPGIDTDEDEADRADREAPTSARRESEDPAGDQS
ncbi:PE-PPE domain-containing protein [Mycobacterium sp. G7A2]|uniref:PE-PPE domain-containing protein n=1 Tax=Mycobacterium sp. G7A2 TaxID=3317307 RepID=UPI0035A8E246